MRTAFLNAIIFILLIALFITTQYALYSYNLDSFIGIALRVLAFSLIIPLGFSGAAILSATTIKRPQLIIAFINLAIILVSLTTAEFSWIYFLKLAVTILLGSSIAYGIAKLLRYNSKKSKIQ